MYIAILVLVIVAASVVIIGPLKSPTVVVQNTSILPVENKTVPTTTPTVVVLAVSTSSTIAIEKKIPAQSPKKPIDKPNIEHLAVKESASTSTAQKAAAPYSTAPEPPEVIEKSIRSALVNILCMPQGGTLKPISASGVIVSPDGVILTNAHVAQYVLLSEDLRINLTCSIRSGSPAAPRWKAAVLYMPEVWVDAHYKELNEDRVSGTGEHDYAFLKIVADSAGNPTTGPFPYLPVEIRENVAFEGDPVLVAGYPAEFVGGLTAQQGLYASISPSSIKQLLTFNVGTIDVLSVGGVVQAQGGSSGGPAVNAWGRVVGLIVTTSAGATTAERDLHTLNLNYISRDFTGNTGLQIESLLTGGANVALDVFTRNIAPGYIAKYITLLSR